MTRPIAAAAIAILERVRPASILAVGCDATALLGPYLEAHPGCRVTTLGAAELLAADQWPARHDVAVVAGALEALDPAQAGTVVARLRDLLAPICLVLLDHGRAPVGPSDMLGYGFERLAQDDTVQGRRALYLFAIDSYKTTPDWLNPRHWANPERWDKHRW